MPTERMEEVEVVVTCTRCGGMSPACWVCEKSDGKEVALCPVAPNSLTSARLRLADAAEAERKARHDLPDGPMRWLDPEADERLEVATMAADDAYRALRTARGA